MANKLQRNRSLLMSFLVFSLLVIAGIVIVLVSKTNTEIRSKAASRYECIKSCDEFKDKRVRGICKLRCPQKGSDPDTKTAFNPVAQCNRTCDLIGNADLKAQCKLKCPSLMSCDRWCSFAAPEKRTLCGQVCNKIASGQATCQNLCEYFPDDQKSGCTNSCQRMATCLVSQCTLDSSGTTNPACISGCVNVGLNQQACRSICSVFPANLQSGCTAVCDSKIGPSVCDNQCAQTPSGQQNQCKTSCYGTIAQTLCKTWCSTGTASQQIQCQASCYKSVGQKVCSYECSKFPADLQPNCNTSCNNTVNEQICNTACTLLTPSLPHDQCVTACVNKMK